MTVINHSWNFVFVHIPKSGGTTVTRALQPLCNWKDLQLGGSEFGELVHKAYCGTFGLAKHSFANELRRNMGPLEWSRYTSYAVVRHPIRRTISTFRYLKHHASHYRFMENVHSMGDFLDMEYWQEGGPDRMFMPQWRWLRPELKKEQACDRWLRLEELETTLKPLLLECGVPEAKMHGFELQHFNASPSSIEAQFTPQQRERIVERYRGDFEMFGYDPETDVFAPDDRGSLQAAG